MENKEYCKARNIKTSEIKLFDSKGALRLYCNNNENWRPVRR